MTIVQLAGWGRHPVHASTLVAVHDMAAAARATTAHAGLIARGNGRAYGDAAIGTQHTLDVRHLDRMRSFDPATGHLVVEAGVLLDDILKAFAPRGYLPAVLPGTRFVTVGGAIAADVHGKNHHRDGSFGAHVLDLVLATPGGQVLRLSRDRHGDLFAATLGGMGLTGTILEATLRLRRIESGWIRQATVAAPDLAATLAVLDATAAATYAVAWVDGLARGQHLGRALVMTGEHASAAEVAAAGREAFPPLRAPRLSLPLDVPSFALNRWTVAAFNQVHYGQGVRRSGRTALVPLGRFFFPLDAIGAWNRLYGRHGFVQHQCVIPTATAPAVLAALLDRVATWDDASFLAVLKKLGPGAGPLSFAREGYTLALDFPVRAGLPAFLSALDALVITGGGRLYLAKDAVQARATFEAGYPDLGQFRDLRRAVDPDRHLRSRLAERLGL
ncbi:FAD-binding protein [Zavarzinia sp. CC-PAN008]|uniref:FAD-binding oxidoreductase n=1 Tax=Zavarzinia sp. CC-PAN008 TaxID=3243332 RepID=UPI003F74561E